MARRDWSSGVMATTTPNYGWSVPESTDLVKDGATAIELLGDSIDSTTKDLNPSTTEGDIEYRSATADTNARLAIGTAGQVLTVNSGADAPEWATPAGGGSMTSLASGSLSTGTLSLTSISASYKDLKLVLRNVTMSGNANVTFKINNLSNFYAQGWLSFYGATVPAATSVGSASNWQANARTIKAGDSQSLTINLLDYANTTSKKQFFSQISNDDSASNEAASSLAFGHRYGTSSNNAIDRLDVILSTGTFSTGTYILYGVN